ncbi:MAG: catechol 2,3-dioxygenase-like lactoylglutathione lyase family enzyme [Oceanicoccus sp.]|jgi:catechol 2,3-dioxygenase-like lactoylglutathione lyase family enzyme
MISYICIGTNNFDAAEKFYDELLAELNVIQAQKTERMIFWVGPTPGVGFSIAKPLDGEPASAGNGAMVALTADSKESVERVYHKAIALGASDEGAPGVRASGFYCAYFRDLDDNKFNIFCPVPPR